MSSFRNQLINWVEARGCKARPCAALRRHEALIGELHLIIEHDPLNPDADARAWIRLTPLPYDATRRKTALSHMLSLNHKMIAQELFGLTFSDAGEYISLACRASAAEISQAEFKSIMAKFLGWAARAQQLFAQEETPNSAPQDLNIRYL